MFQTLFIRDIESIHFYFFKLNKQKKTTNILFLFKSPSFIAKIYLFIACNTCMYGLLAPIALQ